MKRGRKKMDLSERKSVHTYELQEMRNRLMRGRPLTKDESLYLIRMVGRYKNNYYTTLKSFNELNEMPG
jgi:hypothetical protein